MLSWLKSDPRKKLQKAYERRLKDAMLAQRSGDIKTYSLLTEEAEGIYQQIKALEADSSR
ncbi:DUF6435 family protein [Marinimicrobium sp. C6131]|uniref:DUF6435 family protein n=1 Tax=Marinimicrobium sp. C6131 TaxID=3022676 RepID=UPI00223D1290|nr:DUF6435 family protein [Marinimicrobium sp. C6131]UZJ43358.1 DUF6435 family protein [Marinimicrobium sp. C6131]